MQKIFWKNRPIVMDRVHMRLYRATTSNGHTHAYLIYFAIQSIAPWKTAFFLCESQFRREFTRAPSERFSTGYAYLSIALQKMNIWIDLAITFLHIRITLDNFGQPVPGFFGVLLITG